MSPHPSVGNTGPVWDPCPLSLMMESTSTVFCTYGLLTAEVAWQMSCFSCGAAHAAEGPNQPSPTKARQSTTPPDRAARCEPDLPSLTPMPRPVIAATLLIPCPSPSPAQPVTTATSRTRPTHTSSDPPREPASPDSGERATALDGTAAGVDEG